MIARVIGELADLAEAAAAEATAVLPKGRRALPRALSGRVRVRLQRALGELAVTIERIATVVAQVRTRLAGQVLDGAPRLVSLHDGDARPIRKGRTGRPPLRSPPIAGTASLRPSGNCKRSGFATVAIPRRAKTSAARRAIEHARGLRRLVK